MDIGEESVQHRPIERVDFVDLIEQTNYLLRQFVPFAVVVTICLTISRDSELKNSYERIALGMSIDEVRSMLNGSGVNFRFRLGKSSHSGPLREVIDIQEDGTWITKSGDHLPERLLRFDGWDVAVGLRLDEERKVTDKMIIRLKPLGLFDRIRQILGR